MPAVMALGDGALELERVDVGALAGGQVGDGRRGLDGGIGALGLGDEVVDIPGVDVEVSAAERAEVGVLDEAGLEDAAAAYRSVLIGDLPDAVRAVAFWRPGPGGR